MRVKIHPPQAGFTLIELVLVIVLLGVLAVTAAPKFIDLQKDAELAVFNSLGETLLAAANLAHLKQIAQGKGPNEALTINGQTINMRNGYPADDSIGLLVEVEGFTYQPSTGWFVWDAVGSNDCRHDYNYAGWSGNPTPDKPYVLTTRTAC